jgi:hypothetical protein
LSKKSIAQLLKGAGVSGQQQKKQKKNKTTVAAAATTTTTTTIQNSNSPSQAEGVPERGTQARQRARHQDQQRVLEETLCRLQNFGGQTHELVASLLKERGGAFCQKQDQHRPLLLSHSSSRERERARLCLGSSCVFEAAQVRGSNAAKQSRHRQLRKEEVQT